MKRPARAKKGGELAHCRDVETFRLAVLAVGVTVILTGAGITLLTLLERQIPTALIALGSNSLGMLGGLLVPRPHNGGHVTH